MSLSLPTGCLTARAPPAVRQDPTLGGSETFNSFLRKAQQVRAHLGRLWGPQAV